MQHFNVFPHHSVLSCPRSCELTVSCELFLARSDVNGFSIMFLWVVLRPQVERIDGSFFPGSSFRGESKNKVDGIWIL